MTRQLSAPLPSRSSPGSAHARSWPTSSCALALHRVWASCLPENPASQRVLEKVGLHRIGMTPAGSEGGGHPRMDDYLYAVTAAEWAASRSS